MKKLFFLHLIFLLNFNFYYSQNSWVANSTSDATAESIDIVLDDNGNSYIIGYISGDTEFQDIQIDQISGYSDVFVAKINSEGNYVWVKRFGGDQADKGTKITLNSHNEIIITGTFYESITFDNIHLAAANNSKDIFIAKLNMNGDIIWARKDGGSLSDNVYGLTIDHQDNIIITGQFEGNSTFGNQNLISQNDSETNIPSFDIFISKYNSEGNPIWAKSANAQYEDRGIALVCDPSNNIYLTGQFSDTINFFDQTINNEINNAGFIAKLNANGNLVWFNKLAAGQVLAYDIKIDHQQNIVVTGDFLGQLLVWANESIHTISNPYNKKVFILKVNASGSYIWGKANGSNSEVSSRNLVIDDNDNIYIGGHFRCNFDEYRDSTATGHFQSAGFKDIFVSKFNTNGTLLWKNQVGGQKEETCWGMAIKEIDHPVITGSYGLNIIFPVNSNYSMQNSPYVQNGNTKYIYIYGDESINIHVSKMINNNSAYYNYYSHENGTNLSDSISMNIFPHEDFVHFCPPDSAFLETNMVNNIGPLLTGNWNNGRLWNRGVSHDNLDGTYTINVNRLDNCYSFQDDIHIDYHSFPPMPLLTDDHNININNINYQNISMCGPDTLNFSFNGLCTDCSARITIPELNFSENLIENFNYQTNISSIIKINVSSEFCSSTKLFSFDLHTRKTYDSIKPYLILEDTYDFNDSIMKCKNYFVSVIIADSLTNPSGELICNNKLIYSASVSTTVNGVNIPASTNGKRISFRVNETGWYRITNNLILGYSNLCGIDTTRYAPIIDSFYIEVKENPLFSILGNEPLCPNNYNYLHTTEIIPDIEWTGPGILWESTDSDSIKVNESGYYSAYGNYNYGEITCPFQRIVYVQEKHPPIISTNPIDGIICPGDSVLFTLNQEGISYEWYGPEDYVISTNNSVYGNMQGFYACIFTDSEGCQLLTAQAEIREYITPFIDFFPTNVMCTDEPMILNAIHGGLASVQWHSPLNSNDENITINQPGTYTCEINQCGITVIDSVTIMNGIFDFSLQVPQNTNLCYGDSILLQSTDGIYYYQWSNNIINQSSIYVHEPGLYSVIGINKLGCVAKSDTVEINIIEVSVPPNIPSMSICEGNNALISDQSEFNSVWYANPNDSHEIALGPNFSFQNLLIDTAIYVAYANNRCHLNFTKVNIDVIHPLSPPIIIGDSTLCVGEDINLSVNTLENVSYSWIYQNTITSNNSQFSIPNIQLGADSTITLLAQDMCTHNSSNITIEINTGTPVTINHYNDTLCPSNQLVINPIKNDNIFYYWINGNDTISSTILNIQHKNLNSDTLYVFAINSYNCKSDIMELPVIVVPDFDLNLHIDQLLCENNPITISADLSLGNITWTLPDNSKVQKPSIHIESLTSEENGVYIAETHNSFGCLIDDSISISVLGLPKFKIGADTIVCKDSAFDLHIPNKDYSYTWNNYSSESLFTPNGIDPVFLTATDINGCQYTDTILVLYVDCSSEAANVFTPNGDGVNDYFTIFNAEYMQGTYLRILNRWGNVVFEQENYRNDIDASNLNEGVYFYEFFPSGKDGNKKVGYFHLIKG